MSVSTAQTKLGFLRRIIVAVVLVLALLSGLVPFGAASAGHLCTMECCAALPSHAAGSCHMSMVSHGESAESEPQPDLDQHCGLPAADTEATESIDVDAGVMGMTDSANSSADLDDVTIDVRDHCKTDSQSEDLKPPPLNDSRESASIATQSFSKPCPAECGTRALSSGVRRSRYSAAIASHGHSQPPVTVRKRQHFKSNFLITSVHCRQLRPRGPPLSLN
jgi:hypothetical protein